MLKMEWLFLRQCKMYHISADQNPKKEIIRQLILRLTVKFKFNPVKLTKAMPTHRHRKKG